MSHAVIWFRKNLRIQDNSLLSQALKNHDSVTAVYVFDDRWFEQTDKWGCQRTNIYRKKFIHQSLQNLKTSLQNLSIPMHIGKGKILDIFAEIFEINTFDAIYTQSLPGTEELQNFEGIKHLSNIHQVEFKYVDDHTLIHQEDLPFVLADIPPVFTKFRKQVEKHFMIRSCDVCIEKDMQTHRFYMPEYASFGLQDSWFQDIDISFDEKDDVCLSGGESAAWDILNQYIWEGDHLKSYKQTRNGLLGRSFSSKFSPYLAYGCISARQIYHQVKQYEQERVKNDSTYWLIFELLWRDFFQFVAVLQKEKLFLYQGFSGKKMLPQYFDQKIFDKWCNGQTGDSFVDAAMKQLNTTGFLSNRMRQNVASYLHYTLGQDWRAGAAYFESMLVDYDVASNYGNWLYIAGAGNDPKGGRIFDIAWQANRYDPQKKYRKYWL